MNKETNWVTMWRCWTLAIWVSAVTPGLCQSGDGDGEWGSGFGVSMAILAANTSQEVGDEPAGTKNEASPPPLYYQPEPDECSVHFSTSQASARRLKAKKVELAYLKAIQHGNQAVVENLVQYVGAELGEQSYEDVIQENLISIREDHQSCDGVVQKVVEDLEGQLEGDVSEALARRQKIKEESVAFEGMLRAAADIASRLERSSQALHASFTKQLKDTLAVHR